MARNAKLPLAFQFLAVPATDLVINESGEINQNCTYESYRELIDAPALPVERISYAFNNYLGVPRPRGWENVRILNIFNNSKSDNL
jgi:hypothetical protein